MLVFFKTAAHVGVSINIGFVLDNWFKNGDIQNFESLILLRKGTSQSVLRTL